VPDKIIQKIVTLFFLVILPINSVFAWEISGHLGVENLTFTQNSLDNRQHNNYVSGVIEPELYHEWDAGNQSFAFVPYFRYSQHDSRRTHFDIRELTWVKVAETWELRVGIRKLFWGVTESQHLINIINQTDLVENTDTEDKLGQPMINLALINDWGTLDLFLLTGFRERTFPGVEGRIRASPPIDIDNARFEKKGIERHLAYAVRWSHTIGDWDLGFSHFYGTNRDPLFLPETDKFGNQRLLPYYEMINQTGLDLQVTKGSWLWKLEAIFRSSKTDDYFASTAGFEYTFFDVYETGLDIGILGEYLYDSRGQNFQTLFEDDFLVAMRIAFNDVQSTELLAGIIFDRTSSAKFYNIEASRRFGDSWKLNMEARFFSGIPKADPAHFLRDDDHIRLEVSYHF
jgi:hypothetical protein